MTLAKIGRQTWKLINQTQKQVRYRYSLASDMNTGLGPAKPCDCEHLSGQGGHWEFFERLPNGQSISASDMRLTAFHAL